MSRLPAGLKPNDDIAVEHIRDNATVHLPHGCPAAELIEGPTFGAYRVATFSVTWCRVCFRPGPPTAPATPPPHSRSYEVIPHAQHV